MKFGFKKAAARAVGYPKTDDVTAKKLKGSSEIIVKNGSNLFRLPSMNFTKISVAAGQDGAFNLVGTTGETDAMLAGFGSLKAANNALDRVSSAYAGLGGGIRWVRVALCLIAGYALVSIFSGAVVTSAAAASTARLNQIQSGAVPGAQLAAPAALAASHAAQPAPGGFNPNEQTLEELERLAKGGEYRFEPKIAVPNIEAPVLDCATHSSK